MRSSSRLLMALMSAVLCVTVAGCTQGTPPSVTASAGPAAAVTTERYTVRPRTVTITYTLDGKSVTSSAVGLESPPNTIRTLTVRNNETVTAGQVVATYKPDPDTVATLRDASASSTVAASQLFALLQRSGTLRAPTSGAVRVTAVNIEIRSLGLDAVVVLTPLQGLRFAGMPFIASATIETVFGSRTFTCSTLWRQHDNDGMTLHCRIPADVETAAGLPLTMVLSSIPTKGVVAVPAMYVGIDKSGQNYLVNVVTARGTETRKVVVGPTDGVLRIITSGLRAGDVVEAFKDSS